MGLDTSHDAWHGAYSAFHRWRNEIAKAADIPPLDSMEGFGGAVRWDQLKPDPLHVLLHHSDCDGEIAPEDCAKIADRLEELLPKLPDGDHPHIGNWRDKTQRFIDGCRAAAAANEPLDFH